MTTVSPGYQPRPLEATFGYFNTSYSTDKNIGMHRIINLTKALAYIPVVGTIIGIAHIIFYSQLISKGNYSDSERAFAYLQVARGCFEALSIGVIFLIPDLIFTINREFECAKKYHWFTDNFGKFEADKVYC